MIHTQKEIQTMKTRLIQLLAVLSVLGCGNLFAQDLATTIEKGCGAEIEAYCSNVTLGEGRLLACFYAHEDKLSGQCQFALYDASAQLERAVSALNYVAGQCDNDIMTHCAEVQMGEGRIVDCLKSKSEVVSGACSQAINDVFE
jgi:hypothetical protein